MAFDPSSATLVTDAPAFDSSSAQPVVPAFDAASAQPVSGFDAASAVPVDDSMTSEAIAAHNRVAETLTGKAGEPDDHLLSAVGALRAFTSPESLSKLGTYTGNKPDDQIAAKQVMTPGEAAQDIFLKSPLEGAFPRPTGEPISGLITLDKNIMAPIAGAVSGLEDVAEGLPTGLNLLLASTMSGASPGIQRAISAYFATTMGREAAKDVLDAYDAQDPQERARAGVRGITGALMARFALDHAAGRPGVGGQLTAADLESAGLPATAEAVKAANESGQRLSPADAAINPLPLSAENAAPPVTTPVTEEAASPPGVSTSQPSVEPVPSGQGAAPVVGAEGMPTDTTPLPAKPQFDEKSAVPVKEGAQTADTLAASIADARAKAPTELSILAAGKRPVTIDFPRPGGGQYTVQNTQEALDALSLRLGGTVQPSLKYTPAVRTSDGQIYTGLTHPDVYRQMGEAGIEEKGERGYQLPDGSFTSNLLDIARIENPSLVSKPVPSPKPAAVPATEPAPSVESKPLSIDEVVQNAVAEHGSIASAHEALQTRIDDPSTPPDEKINLRLAQRRLESIVESEYRREQAEALNEAQNQDSDELLDVVRKYRSLPASGSPHYSAHSGEIDDVMDAMKARGKGTNANQEKLGPVSSLFSNDSPSVDDLRQQVNSHGFDFETPYDLLAAVKDRVQSGVKIYGTKDASGIPIGPGAANAGNTFDFPPQKTTGLKRIVVDTERLSRGAPEIPTPERQSEDAVVSNAEDSVDNDATVAPSLISSILDHGQKGISEKDAAVLLVERTRLNNLRRQWEDVAGDESVGPDAHEQARDELDAIEKQLERVDQAQRAVGTQWGRMGHMYQRLMLEDYSLEAMERKERADKGRPLNEDERAVIKDRADRIAALEKEVEGKSELERQAKEDAEVIRTHEATIKQLEASGKTTFGKDVFDIAHKIVNSWKTEADASRKAIRASLGYANIGVDPTLVLHVAKVIRAKIGEFGLSKAEALTSVIAEFGDTIRPYFSKAWDRAIQLIEGEKASAGVKKRLKSGVKAKGEKTPVDIRARAKAEATAGEALSHKTVYDLARAHINEGVHGEDAVMKAVHGDIQQFYPAATERDVRRAFSEYGKVKFPSADADKMELRELRTLVRLQESIDRETAGLDSLHSGLQRDKASQAVRDKQRQLNELLKQRQGPPSPEKLASRDEARKTSLQNQIDDLDRQLSTGEAPPGRAPGLPDSPEVERMKAERDAMKTKLAEIEAENNPPPPEHVTQLADLMKRERDLAERIARGDIEPPAGKPTADTADVAAAKERLAGLRSKIADMRQAARDAENPPKTDAEKQTDALSKIRQRLDDVLSGAREPVKRGDFKPLSQAAEDIKAEIHGMQELAAQLKKDAKPKGDPDAKAEAARIKALEDSIERYRQRTESGDFTSPQKTHGPDSRKVAALKEVLASRKSMYEAAKKAGRPVRTPEERYNATRLKAVTKQIADIQDRMKRRDYAPKLSPIPKVKTAEVSAAEAKLEEAKREIQDAHQAYLRENRSTPQKLKDAFTDSLKLITAVKVLGHGTVGMVTHAGGLIWRPTRAAIYWRNFGRQWPLWISKTFHEQLIHKLRSDPDFDVWKQAGASIDPGQTYTDYGMYAKWLGKLGMNGARGFDALKLARLELNKADWENVPGEIKADPRVALETRQRIAEINNKATGAISTKSTGLNDLARNPIVNAALFAPKLYASRWTRAVLDPIRTAGTFLDWKRASPADRYAAMSKAKHAGEFVAAYVGALAANQAILSATGSKQSVNFSDPKKSDWLKFKAGNKEIVADGGLLDPVRLVGQIVIGDLIQNRTDSQRYREGTRFEKVTNDLGRYMRGKLNPTLGFVVDAGTGSDFQGRPLPWSNEPSKFKDQPKYTWLEWLLQQGPIPLSGGVRVAYDAMRDKGMSHVQAMQILQGAAVSAIGTTGVHVNEDREAVKAGN